MTNLAARATRAASELLRRRSSRAGARALDALVAEIAPRLVAIVGVTAYRVAFGRQRAAFGLQEETIGGRPVWVLPNPSGLNAHVQVPELARPTARRGTTLARSVTRADLDALPEWPERTVAVLATGARRAARDPGLDRGPRRRPARAARAREVPRVAAAPASGPDVALGCSPPGPWRSAGQAPLNLPDSCPTSTRILLVPVLVVALLGDDAAGDVLAAIVVRARLAHRLRRRLRSRARAASRVRRSAS